MFSNTINNDTYTDRDEISTDESEQKTIELDQRSLSQITIKQIMSAKPPANEEHLMIDGEPVTNVEMMAIIKSIEFNASSLTLIVNDLTGGDLKVKRWAISNDEFKNNNYDDLEVGKWIRILGRMKHFNGICSVDAFFIEAIKLDKFDTLTHHLLSIIYQHELKQKRLTDIKKARLENDKKNAALYLGITSNDNNNKENMLPMDKDGSFKESTAAKRYGAQPEQTPKEKLDAAIINIIRKFPNNDTGCSINIVFEQLPKENMEDIREHMVSLNDDGYIYTTLDDETFKVCGDYE